MQHETSPQIENMHSNVADKSRLKNCLSLGLRQNIKVKGSKSNTRLFDRSNDIVKCVCECVHIGVSNKYGMKYSCRLPLGKLENGNRGKYFKAASVLDDAMYL